MTVLYNVLRAKEWEGQKQSKENWEEEKEKREILGDYGRKGIKSDMSMMSRSVISLPLPPYTLSLSLSKSFFLFLINILSKQCHSSFYSKLYRDFSFAFHFSILAAICLVLFRASTVSAKLLTLNQKLVKKHTHNSE